MVSLVVFFGWAQKCREETPKRTSVQSEGCSDAGKKPDQGSSVPSIVKPIFAHAISLAIVPTVI